MRKRLVAWKVTCFRKLIYTDSINWTGRPCPLSHLTCIFIYSKYFSVFDWPQFFIFITCWFWPNLENILGYTIIAIGHSDIKEWCTVWHEIFAGVYFCGLGTIGFSCWELSFAIFRKYPVPNTDSIFVFIKYVQ